MSPSRIGFLAFVEHTGVDGTRSEGLEEGFRSLGPRCSYEIYEISDASLV